MNISDYFERTPVERDGSVERFRVTLKDDAPETVRDAVYSAHGDELPNDFVYERFYEMLVNVEEQRAYGVEWDDIYVGQIAEDAQNIYTSGLLQWLAEMPAHRMAWCDEVLSESSPTDTVDLLMEGQWRHLSYIAEHVIELVRAFEDSKSVLADFEEETA